MANRTTSPVTVGTKFPNGVSIPEGKMYIDDVGVTATAAELNKMDGVTKTTAEINDLATKAGAETLTNKTLTSPVITTPDVTAGIVAALDLSAGDVTLSAAQAKAGILEVTTGHASNAIIAPATAGKMYWVVNNHATLAANIKVAAGVAVTVAATKKALVYFNGTNYIRLTTDT